MKHVALITQTVDSPAKAESLLAKAQIIANIGDAVAVLQDVSDLLTKE